MIFIKSQPKDLDFIVSLRNEYDSARFSKRGIISENQIKIDHFDDPNNSSYVVHDNTNSVIGYVLFSDVGVDCSEISVAITPFVRGRGIGKKLIRAASVFGINTLRKTRIIAKILDDNIASISAFTKSGYIETERELDARVFYFDKQDNITRCVAAFDFDGVVVDSVDKIYCIYKNKLLENNIVFSREDFNQLGGSVDDACAHISKKYGIVFGIDEQLMQMYDEMNINEEVIDTINIMKKFGLAVVLVSSAPRKYVDTVLNRYNNLFDLIVCGDQAKKAKPDPELYSIVKSVFVSDSFFAFEDSLCGTQAALAAGFKPIMVGNEPWHHFGGFSDQTAKQKVYSILGFDLFIGDVNIHMQGILNDSDENFDPKNGKIFSVDSIQKQEHSMDLCVNENRYNNFRKQLSGEGLNINLLAVSCIVIDNNGNTIIAKRSNDVTLYKGFYELAVSGCVSPEVVGSEIDIRKQVVQEMKEEIGLECGLDNVISFGSSYNKHDHVLDIMCVALVENLSAANINDEYSAFKILSITDAKRFLVAEKSVPLSAVMLDLYGSLK